jgi:hypothetical protein
MDIICCLQKVLNLVYELPDDSTDVLKHVVVLNAIVSNVFVSGASSCF